MSGHTVPGICAEHLVISDACREAKGDEGALEEALADVRKHYGLVTEGWQTGKGAKVHIVMTVERPEGNDGDSQTSG